MRYISLFSGIEACSVAWKPLGWQCAAVAEIEPFPCSVLAHHYPDVPNLGDVTKITEEQIAALGPIDVVVGGSPCQDLSVAGKRRGLAGARSSLFHEQLRIFHAARHFCGARFLVWENVPGAFSSNNGADFAVVVGAMAGCELAVPADGWANEGLALGEFGLVEWAVLDAQWFRVAQRRRRVFAVLDTGNWADRRPILLESDGLRGDSAPRREAGQSPAGCLAARTGSGGGLGTDVELDGGIQAFDGNNTSGAIDVVACLTAGGCVRNDFDSETFVAHTLRGEGFDASEDGSGRGTPLVPVPIQNATRGQDQNGLGIGGDVMFTLDQGSQHGVAVPIACREVAGALAAEPGMKQQTYLALHVEDVAPTLTSGPTSKASHGKKSGTDREALVAFDSRQNTISNEHVTCPLDATSPQAQAVAFMASDYKSGQFEEADTSRPITTSADRTRAAPVAAQGMAVRRLTPRECERLQGFPDDYTLIVWRGRALEKCPDGPRYKALGNSMAVPVMTWIGQQIMEAAN